MKLNNLKMTSLMVPSGFVRVRLYQFFFLKKVEKRQAKSVFWFKNLKMSFFVSSNAWKKNFDIKNLKKFLR